MFLNLLGRVAATLQSFRIHAVRLGGTPHRHHERRHIARHRGVVRDERMRADLTELMNAGEAAHVHPVADDHVTAERAVVRQHTVRADDAVVADVRAGHEQVVAADPA